MDEILTFISDFQNGDIVTEKELENKISSLDKEDIVTFIRVMSTRGRFNEDI